MLKRRIRTLAVTGIAIVAAALVSLGTTTAASAATTAASAPAHVTAARAAAAPSGCVAIQFGTWDQNTYERCVRDEQILLNDLHYGLVDGMNRVPLLTVDGYYGSHTYSVVRFFQGQILLHVDGITGPQTWSALCVITYKTGYTGAYWHDAGCPSEI